MSPEGWHQTEDSDYNVVDPDGRHWDGWVDAFVGGVLGFCCCGSPEMVTDLLLGYLSATRAGFGEAEHPDMPDQGDSSPELAIWLLCAYIADKAELADHGGSVYGAWLTKKGKQWREVLRQETQRP